MRSMDVVELLVKWIWPGLKRQYRRFEIWRLQHKQPPLAPDDALRLALACLGGQIMETQSFENLDGSVYVAALHTTADNAAIAEIPLLERGKSPINLSITHNRLLIII